MHDELMTCFISQAWNSLKLVKTCPNRENWPDCAVSTTSPSTCSAWRAVRGPAVTRQARLTHARPANTCTTVYSEQSARLTLVPSSLSCPPQTTQVMTKQRKDEVLIITFMLERQPLQAGWQTRGNWSAPLVWLPSVLS